MPGVSSPSHMWLVNCLSGDCCAHDKLLIDLRWTLSWRSNCTRNNV